MFEHFTDRGRRVVVLAQEEARMFNHNYIGTEHLLLGLIQEHESVAAKALESLGISLEAVHQQVEEIIGQGQQAPSGHIPFTPRAKRVLQLSVREALQLGHNFSGPEHILLSLIREGDGVAVQVLVSLGADLNRVRQQVIQLLHRRQDPDPAPAANLAELVPRTVLVESISSTPLALDQFGRNLTAAARGGRLDPVIGREKEIERVIQVLSRRTRNNPILVGVPGVGKTAVVEGIAQKIVQGEVPATIRDKQVYTLDLAVLAVAPHASFADQLTAILDEISGRPDIVVLIDDVRALFSPGAPGEDGNLASVARLKLIRGEIQLVLSATAQEYAGLMEKDSMLRRSIQIIEVAESGIAQSVEILKGTRDGLERHHQVTISDDALIAAVELAAEHIKDQPLPEKAIDLLDQACAQVAMQQAVSPPEHRTYDEEIAAVRQAKEAAIDAQEWEIAASLRDQEKRLLATRDMERSESLYVVPEVQKIHIVEALAVVSGVSAADVLSEQASAERTPKYPPSAMTTEDKQIWAISLSLQPWGDRQPGRRAAHQPLPPGALTHGHAERPPAASEGAGLALDRALGGFGAGHHPLVVPPAAEGPLLPRGVGQAD